MKCARSRGKRTLGGERKMKGASVLAVARCKIDLQGQSADRDHDEEQSWTQNGPPVEVEDP